MPRDFVSPLISLLLVGCGAGWQYREPSISIEPEEQVQVWHAGQSEIWHAVRTDSVMVSGIPYHRPRTCETCRRSVARAEVDSLRLGSLHGGLRNSALLAFGMMGLFVYLFRGIGGT